MDPEEIEDLINELEDLSDSGPDVDTISVGSTPKPSLRWGYISPNPKPICTFGSKPSD